jgi:hypothetical protein
MFNILIILVAMVIAGVAAFFSVSGLGQMFAGAFIPVVIMASSLEIGKLVTASFLTRNWKKLTKVLRIYYTCAVLILVAITSMGIYGFLTAAYQTTSDELNLFDQQTQVFDLRRSNYQEQLDMAIQDREAINGRVSELTTGLSNNVIQYRDTVSNEIITTTSVNTRRALQAELDDAREQRALVTSRIEEFSDSVLSIDTQKLNLQMESGVAGEVGPLRYLSNLTGWSMDNIVNVIALLIVFVFDPLAVSLVVGYNYIKTREENEDELSKIHEEIEEISPIQEPVKNVEIEVEVESELETNVTEPLDKHPQEVLYLEEDKETDPPLPDDYSGLERLRPKR